MKQVELAEDVARAGQHTLLDSREVLTELLSFYPIRDGRALLLYLQLLQRTLRQLFLDTLRRRRARLAATVELLRATQVVLRAWYAEVEGQLSRIIMSLVQRDALPSMVRTVKKFGEGASPEGEGSGSDNESDDTVSGEDSNVVTMSIGPEHVVALMDLVSDLGTLCGNCNQAATLMLMVRAAAAAAQPFVEEGMFLGKTVGSLRKWAASLCPVESVKGDVKVSALELRNLGEGTSVEVCNHALQEALLCAVSRLLVDGDVAGFVQSHTLKLFHGELRDSLSYDDRERGRGTSDARALATLQDLKAEKDALCVVSDTDDSDDLGHGGSAGDAMGETSDGAAGPFSLRSTGALLFLCDLMCVGTCSPVLFSASSRTLFFYTCPMALAALRSPSLTVVMAGLAYLALLLPLVPPYSLQIRGEAGKLESNLDKLNSDSAASEALDFSTRKFEVMFELAKSLVTVSATCPCESHRLISRAVFTALLHRCGVELRLRMCSSFMVLTPFASVCSLMLHALRNECCGCDIRRTPAEEFLNTTLPLCLIKAQENWLRRLRASELGFVDPMVQSINFVRCIIVDDSKREGGEKIFYVGEGDDDAHPSEPNSSSTHCKPWKVYASRFLKEVAPPLRSLLASSDSSVPTESLLRREALSPLDQFSLEMALDGLERQLDAHS
uniref:Uncharacterized protein n=1 Tax=Trypanosoma vivax (strain Y486) TaxID=1055687 RepID=G0U9P4_TRYVY|nr:conserved hypothetical protein [Trypanosoma vivax Y486]